MLQADLFQNFVEDFDSIFLNNISSGLHDILETLSNSTENCEPQQLAESLVLMFIRWCKYVSPHWSDNLQGPGNSLAIHRTASVHQDASIKMPYDLETASIEQLLTIDGVGPFDVERLLSQRRVGPVTTWASFRKLVSTVSFPDFVRLHQSGVWTSRVHILQPSERHINLNDVSSSKPVNSKPANSVSSHGGHNNNLEPAVEGKVTSTSPVLCNVSQVSVKLSSDHCLPQAAPKSCTVTQEHVGQVIKVSPEPSCDHGLDSISDLNITDTLIAPTSLTSPERILPPLVNVSNATVEILVSPLDETINKTCLTEDLLPTNRQDQIHNIPCNHHLHHNTPHRTSEGWFYYEFPFYAGFSCGWCFHIGLKDNCTWRDLSGQPFQHDVMMGEDYRFLLHPSLRWSILCIMDHPTTFKAHILFTVLAGY
jgi:hypothetical protein